MHRRDFIKVTGLAGGIALVPGIFSGCSGRERKALEGWNVPSVDQPDIRITILSYAILAANPHNKQPWIIDLKSPNQFDLYVDQTRLLPETDPPFRQIHISQGAFLENLDLASQHFGYQSKISYFPFGMYSNLEIEATPIATVELTKQEKLLEDPLFDHILNRTTNRKPYEQNRELSDSHLANLRDAYNANEYRFEIITEPEQRKTIAEFLGKAMEIETSGKQRHAETVAMFRFDDDEVEKYRDGFGLANMGITGFKKWFAENFFLDSREVALGIHSAFAKKAIELAYDQARSASAFGLIISKTNTRLDQVKVGRAYQRINLAATKLGVALHPMSQILQEYPDMASLQKEFLGLLGITPGETAQMIFRLGYADPGVHTARQKTEDKIRQKG